VVQLTTSNESSPEMSGCFFNTVVKIHKANYGIGGFHFAE